MAHLECIQIGAVKSDLIASELELFLLRLDYIERKHLGHGQIVLPGNLFFFHEKHTIRDRDHAETPVTQEKLECGIDRVPDLHISFILRFTHLSWDSKHFKYA